MPFLKNNKLLIKTLSFGFVFSLLLTPALFDLKNNEPVGNPIEEVGENVLFYPASYSESEFTGEPKYSTQFSETFSTMNIGTYYKHYDGDTVKVAVIDSGLKYTHEDFSNTSGQIIQDHSRAVDNTSGEWLYYQFDSFPNKLNDTFGHGTNVASVIASQINEVGCAGLAPNVELYIYKVTNSDNGYEWKAINSALQYCIDEGIDVINMSFQAYEHAVSYGGSSMAASTGCSTVMTSMLNKCHNAGITLVAAAGNFNTIERSYPASNNYVISVGSLEEKKTDIKAGFSNLSDIDLVAPGYVYVAGKDSNSYYKKTQGTSFSAPIVTAAIALYKQKYPNATPAQIEEALYDSCDPVSGTPSWAGNGRLNLANFLGINDYVTDIVVNNVSGSLEMEVGDTFDIDYTVSGVGDFDPSVTITYEDLGDEPSVSVSGDTLTALKEGDGEITIVSNDNPDVKARFNVTVTPKKTLVLSPTELSIEEGFTGQLTATVEPATTVTFSSSDTAVATVNQNGLVTAISPGTATISASAYGIVRTSSITVTKSPLESISLEGQTTTYQLNSDFSFTGKCIAHYHNEHTKEVTPTSVSSPDMTSEGEKTVTVTYTEGTLTKTATYTINVVDKVTTGLLSFANATSVTSEDDGSIWASSNSTSGTSYLHMKQSSSKVTSSAMNVDTSVDVDYSIRCGTYGGGSSTLSLKATNPSGTAISNTITLSPPDSDETITGTIHFTSSSPSGVIFVLIANPDTTNTRYIRLYSLKFDYKALPQVKTLSLDNTEFNFDLYGTKTGTITPTVTADPGVDTTVTYSLSQNGIVSLSKSSGTATETITVTALAVGSVTITATCGNKQATCEVSVVDTTPIPVTSLTISNTSLSITEGLTANISASVLPTNATNKELLWSTSNASIVGISSTSGEQITLTANGDGGQKATITVSTTDGSLLSKQCEVTIVDKVVVTSLVFEDLPTIPFASTFSLGNTKVKAIYSDASTKYVTNSATIDTSKINTKVLGNNEITASYVEDNIEVHALDYVKVTNQGASDNVGIDVPGEHVIETRTVSYTFTSKDDVSNITDLNLSTDSNSNGYEDNRGMQFSKLKVSLAISGMPTCTIKEISVVASGNCEYTLSAKVGTTTFGTNQTVSNGDSKVTKTFTGSQSNGTITISSTEVTGKSAYIKSFSIKYEIETVTPGIDYPASPTEQAVAWANYFLDELQPLCAADGNTSEENLTIISNKWTTFSNEYGWMTSESKAEFVNNPTGDVSIAKAQEIYAMIILKYKYNNFVTDGNNNSLVIGNHPIIFGSESQNVLLITIVLGASLFAVSSYYLIKRRKEK